MFGKPRKAYSASCPGGGMTRSTPSSVLIFCAIDDLSR